MDLFLSYRTFLREKIKTQKAKKGPLMAELAFAYEAKKVSVPKVVHWVVFFFVNFSEK